jgi:hypothetical protein
MMTALTAAARWEWRTFGTSLGDAERRVLAGAGEPRISRETYFVRWTSDLNVKVRNGALDVKVRLRIDDYGVEQWTPVIKTHFPVGSDEMVELFSLWNRRLPAARAVAHTEESFRRALAADPDIVVQDLTKERRASVQFGCQAEWAAITIDGTRLVTLGFEDNDPATVRGAVESIGLRAIDNVNYVEAIRRLRANSVL